MKTKTYNLKALAKKRLTLAIAFLAIAIAILVINPNYQIGNIRILNTLLIATIVLLAIAIRDYYFLKEIKYDERTQMIMLNASKATLATLIYSSIVLMLIGTIQKISIDLATSTIITLFAIIFIHKFFYWHFNKKM